MINIPTYVIHHNPEYWPEPELFKPERCQHATCHIHSDMKPLIHKIDIQVLERERWPNSSLLMAAIWRWPSRLHWYQHKPPFSFLMYSSFYDQRGAVCHGRDEDGPGQGGLQVPGGAGRDHQDRVPEGRPGHDVLSWGLCQDGPKMNCFCGGC